MILTNIYNKLSLEQKFMVLYGIENESVMKSQFMLQTKNLLKYTRNLVNSDLCSRSEQPYCKLNTSTNLLTKHYGNINRTTIQQKNKP